MMELKPVIGYEKTLPDGNQAIVFPIEGIEITWIFDGENWNQCHTPQK